MSTDKPAKLETPTRQIRAAKPIWKAFDLVCARLETNSAESIRKHIEDVVRADGTPEEIALLEEGLRQMAEARSRMHPGRPRKMRPTGP